MSKKSHPVKIEVTTGSGHKAITPEMIIESRKHTKEQRGIYSQHTRPRRSTSEQDAFRLREAWDELEERREQLEKDWPEDITHPRIPVVSGIDWDQQPSIPAEHIDWSGQGQPVRVKFTLGTMVGVVTMIMSILGAGAYFYWGVKTHIANQQIHVPPTGIPWGVPTKFETRKEARKARSRLHEDLKHTITNENRLLKQDVIKAIKRRYNRRR